MSFNFISMIPRIIMLVIMLMACVIIISLYLNNKFNTRDVTAEILVNGFIYGAGGINYYDPVTGRHHPGIIDLDQFSADELDQAFYYPQNNLITAKISVSKESDPNQPALKTVYYNKEWYDNWYPLIKLKIPGIGGLSEYTKTLPVIYRASSGELKAGYVHFQVVQPK